MAKYGLAAINGYIYVKYTHQNQRFRISTRFQSEELFDPVTKSLEPRHPDFLKAKQVTDLITNNMISASTRVQTAGFEPTCHLVRQEYYKVLEGLDPEPKKSKYPDFYERWHEFMKIKSTEMRIDGFRNYTQLYNLLREFEHYDNYQMDFGTFDAVMFGRFKQFMFLIKHYQDATSLKHINKLRTFFKWAVPELDRSFMKFKPALPKNIHPLEPGEFRYLIDAELGGYMESTRDLFVFCACTGMRYSDSQRFEKQWIREGIINYTQRKTTEDAIVPLLDTANKILVKYGMTTPKMSNPAYNRNIKDLFKHLEFNRLVRVQYSNAGKMEEKIVHFWQQAGSHTARRTFITFALYQGIPIQDVMKMSGHADYEMMKPYIAISREHLKEEAKKFDL